MDNDPKKNDDQTLKTTGKKKISEQIVDLYIQELTEEEFGKEEQELLESITKSSTFDKDIELLLEQFSEGTNDLTQLQSKIILLIKKYLAKPDKLKELKIDEKSLTNNIAEISNHIMQQHKMTNDLGSDAKLAKSRYQSISEQPLQNLKKIVKGFMVYEMYKAINPRRIAGETGEENFYKNVVVRGMEEARHYTGGSKEEIKHYSQEKIRKAEIRHGTFKHDHDIGR